MKINFFFTPLPSDMEQYVESSTISLSLYTEQAPNWKDADIVLMSIPDYRELKEGEYTDDLNVIRRHFYSLNTPWKGKKIVDLGDLKPGPSKEDTYLRIKEVVSHLLQENCIPIILGGSHDLSYGQYLAYVENEQLVHMANASPTIDLFFDNSRDKKSLLGEIILHEPNHLFGYTHLAHQSFLTAEEDLSLMDQFGFESIRIGDLKDNIKEVEPYIRMGDFLAFDIQAIRASDSPCSTSPFGFSAEEACQTAWYAGQNNQMSSIGLYQYRSDTDHNERSAQIYATMLWYFIDGYYHRKGEGKLTDKHYLKFTVTLEKADIVFFKDNLSDKWWLEIGTPIHAKSNRKTLLACNYADYEEAISGKIPERWLNAQIKN
ncbi:MAG: arginase family protein [Cyclobacteriaceae bacterium]